MEILYRHRQVAWTMMGFFLIVTAAIVAATAFLLAQPDQTGTRITMMALGGSLVLLAVILGCFYGLTVTIMPEKLTLSFGPGIIRKSIKLSTIASAKPVTNKWWYGFGIHITPHGWLYNVSGLKAVEIHTWSGASLRIGTDEPEALCLAIEQARASNPSA
ncbi:MAG TPA: hypothetical protein VLH60_07755 [Sedimentisphaerales bacterium]|nr:hypothetical protein [Sedimentisphaerales bacterium]